MENPFGIPNDLMDAIVRAAVKQQMEKSHTPNNSLKGNSAEMAKKSASTAKQLYDAYMEAGFTQEQAFELVKNILTANKN